MVESFLQKKRASIPPMLSDPPIATSYLKIMGSSRQEELWLKQLPFSLRWSVHVKLSFLLRRRLRVETPRRPLREGGGGVYETLCWVVGVCVHAVFTGVSVDIEGDEGGLLGIDLVAILTKTRRDITV
jgi:hypothetical protein